MAILTSFCSEQFSRMQRLRATSDVQHTEAVAVMRSMSPESSNLSTFACLIPRVAR